VGPKLAQVLARKDLETVQDLLYFFPRAYEDRRKIHQLNEVKAGEKVTVMGQVHRSHPVFFSRSRRRAFEVILTDESAAWLKLTWFASAAYLQKSLGQGVYLMATGEVTFYRGELQIVHPEIEILGKEPTSISDLRGLVPIYSETEGLYQKTIRRIARKALDQYSHRFQDLLPDSILQRYAWPNKSKAVQFLHQPTSETSFDELLESKTPAQQRLIYEEFFRISLSLAIRRQDYVEAKAPVLPKPIKFWEVFGKNLPFRFTAAQKKVLHEILEDLESGRMTHRLIQGDVGSGKTVVAAAAALVALEASYQVAIMAPTELLVLQHFENFKKWFEGIPVRIICLTGSSSTKEQKEVLEQLKQPEPTIIFGTHSLFEDRVEFSRLGMVIVDEQHRFGVRQRARLIQKGSHPHVLVMTATPIPRTLSLTLYGDLDFSVIDELPPGRKPVATKVFTEKQRPALIREIRGELQKGRQAYIVFPLIEESEKLPLKSIQSMLPEIQSAYSEFKVSFLHGKIPSEEKRATLQDFKNGKVDVLVSTTVVEVGVDIPNATVMVVEHAERFGLSQLHQLRGRIGRGSEQSFCFLMASHLGTPEIVKRLRTMETLADGFKLAEVDLEMRGPGEFLGTKQSGVPYFQLGRLPRDFELLQIARKDAFEIVGSDPKLKNHPQLRSWLEGELHGVSWN